MSKAFTKETDSDEDTLDSAVVEKIPSGQKNYMTPRGFANLKTELRSLLYTERPKIVEIVSWAAGNGDRSENGDYIYGKKRLREIDRRVRYLTKSIEGATVVNPAEQKNTDQVFFGATVRYRRDDGIEQTVTIVGLDEADMACGKISWLSPIARALMKSSVGDAPEFRTPGGLTSLEILSIHYETEIA